jgi:hypothetical protein
VTPLIDSGGARAPIPMTIDELRAANGERPLTDEELDT